MNKAKLIRKYSKAYVSLHGVKPRSMDVANFTTRELQEGIRVLTTNKQESK